MSKAAFAEMCAARYGWSPRFGAGVGNDEDGHVGSVDIIMCVEYKHRVPQILSKEPLLREARHASLFSPSILAAASCSDLHTAWVGRAGVERVCTDAEESRYLRNIEVGDTQGIIIRSTKGLRERGEQKILSRCLPGMLVWRERQGFQSDLNILN